MISATSGRNKLFEAQEKRNLIEVNTLIDLTDKPIGLTRDEISWAKVKSNASNCICCCNNNSITLVTTDNSYILNHIPIDDIQFAQTNSSLQHLALSNNRKIVIIDLNEHDKIDSTYENCNNSNNNDNNSNRNFQNASKVSHNNTNKSNETKVVNLVAFGLTVNDIIYWRWIDEFHLAILSYEALYTCDVNQPQINHPAYTAITSNRVKYLSIQKVFDTHQYLSALCQVTDIQQDLSQNYFAISGLYSTNSLLRNSSQFNPNQPALFTNSQQLTSTTTSNGTAQFTSQTLRSTFGSMPSKLSQLANYDLSFDNSRSEHLFDLPVTRRNNHYHQHHMPSVRTEASSSSIMGGIASNQIYEDEVCGLIQVYCKIRNRSQLIQAHAITFTNPYPPQTLFPSSINYDHDSDLDVENPTILVAANKIGDQLRIHFIEMASKENYLYHSGQNSSPMVRFNCMSRIDFPTSIVCSYVSTNNTDQNTTTSGDQYLHVAFITTKHGQLFVCSVKHSTVLFNTSITPDIISSTVLESNTQGLMVICRNGRVLLAKLRIAKLLKLLEESKSLKHISSCHNLTMSSLNGNNIDNSSDVDNSLQAKANDKSSDDASNINLEILISTKL